jgi:hypothetical protein
MTKTETLTEVIYTSLTTSITIKKDDDYIDVHQITKESETDQTWQELVNYLDSTI